MDKSDTQAILDRIVSIDEALGDYKVAARRDYDRDAETLRQRLQEARREAEVPKTTAPASETAAEPDDPAAAAALRKRCDSKFQAVKPQLLAEFIDVITKA